MRRPNLQVKDPPL